MKNLFILCFCLMNAFQVSAQLNLKDSTAQIVAYWNKGEKYCYNYAAQTIEIKGTDTTELSYSESKFELEVIDSSANGYLINYTKLSEAVSISDEKSPIASLLKRVANIGNSISITFKTNEYGSLQEIVNFDEYKNSLMSQLETLIKEMEKELKDKTTRKALNTAIAPFMSDAYVYKSIEPITSLFSFHGYKFKLNERYTDNIQVASPFEQGKTLDGELQRYVAEFNPETTWTTFHSVTRYDKEQLKMTTLHYINSLLPENQKITSTSEVPEMSMDSYTSFTIHLGTGWPGYASFLQETGEPTKTKLKKWVIEIEL
ncbi:MAG: hypothetical protein E7121_04410 [Bacteroidales bacterium]|nr:hypothetical protein [Bacteroidales bacterium]